MKYTRYIKWNYDFLLPLRLIARITSNCELIHEFCDQPEIRWSTEIKRRIKCLRSPATLSFSSIVFRIDQIDSKLIKESSHLANVIAVKSFVGLIAEYVYRSNALTRSFARIAFVVFIGWRKTERKRERLKDRKASIRKWGIPSLTKSRL